ncbi:CHASE domain-containing protein [Sulfitobacter sp. AS59]|uniref:CHASE domain-containing protein n=1 Tax=Sulfitobacter sp. AS59 TaxID=3135784 RepID=UPI003175713C
MSKAAANAEFQRITDVALQALRTRVDIYLQSLNGAAGMMQASENTEVDDFEMFASSLDLAETLPGINGIGFIEPVPADEVPEFVAGMRAAGVENFTVHPETESDVKYIIKYIAPTDINVEAVGLDISFEQGRREAANRARETGLPQLTPRILLVQDDTAQPGFLLLRPYFDADDFKGWVYAPFVGRNLLEGLNPQQGRLFEFQVYDGNAIDDDALIYSTHEHEHMDRLYTADYTVDMFGRQWTLHYHSTALFNGVHATRGPFFILIGGLLLSMMLAFAMRALRMRNESLAEVAKLRAKKINAREEENRSLVENTVVAVMILDEDRKIVFANHAATNCFDGKREGLNGLCFSDFVTELSEDDAHQSYNALGHTLTGRELFLDLHTNGWVTSSGKRRTTVILRDVTTDVEIADELVVTKQRFDAALSGSQIGVFEIDLKTGTSVVSHTWRDIMDIDQEIDNPQEVFMERIHPDDMTLLLEADRRCIRGETIRSIAEYRVAFGDNWRWMRSDAVVVQRDEDGKALRMVGTQTDVTELRHSRNALEASEKRFRVVLEAAPVGMATLNSGGFFIGVNPALTELTGYSDIEMLKDFNLDRIIPKEDMDRMIAAVLSTVHAGTQDVYREEFRILHKNGGHRWGLFNITWNYDKNIGSYVYIAQVVDITDKKKIEQIKSEFVSTVSHELRTPLTSIKGALGLIEMAARDKLPASALRLVQIAQSNSDRLTDIVNDILDLEKISSGEISFNMVEVELCELVRSAQSEMMPFAVTHKTKLELILPDEELYVVADSGRMMQVMANLISNACKYSYDDTDVTVTVEKLDEVAIVYVQNIGAGVPESFKGRIFQRFSQADGSDTRAKGGTGLGLNITREIVWRQGGEIGFESKPDGPTVFWFTCPIAQASEVQTPALQRSSRPEPGKRLKVLHLEDDEDFAEVIRAGISAYADVHNVTRIRNTRSLLTGETWDVIILDWTVPDGDASILLDEIIEKQPNARIVVLTSDGIRAKDERVCEHIVKSHADMDRIIDCVINFAENGA